MKWITLVMIAGCAGNGSGGFEIDGTVQGSGAPAKSHVIVVWDLVDTGFKFGDGAATGTSFALTLDADPPAGAITPVGIAVGYPMLVADGTVIPDGAIDAKTVQTLGIAVDFAVIWRDVSKAGLGTWDTAFGPRYSCGKCVRSQTGHDSFELTPCLSFTIVFGGTMPCNWA